LVAGYRLLERGFRLSAFGYRLLEEVTGIGYRLFATGFWKKLRA
jgi:hypothetical protein